MSRPTRKPTVWTLRIKHRADQPKHAAQANPGRHFSHSVGFLFQESLLETSFPLRRKMSARISLCGMRSMIWVDTLCRVHNVVFLSRNASYVLIYLVFCY